MGVLRSVGWGATVAVMLAACYEPEYRDCQAKCSGDDSCAPGQVCGRDGLCAAPEIAGSCAAMPDAGEASPIDAARPDAEPTAELRVVVSGKGRVLGDAFGVDCAGEGNDAVGDCRFMVPRGASLTLVAVEIHHGWGFDRWEREDCGDAPECQITVEAPGTLVAATFRRFDQDD